MFCPSCGKEIPDESRYCLACGKSPSATLGVGRPIGREEPVSKTHTFRNVLLGFIGLLVLYVVWITIGGQAPGMTRRDALTPPIFNVKAGTIYYVRFNVERSGRVVGRFQASGGQGNDIQAVITDADNFENWSNGHQARVLYQTDKTTIGNIDVPIGRPGTYYIGFNNKFSLLSDKTVSASVLLIH